MSFRPTSARSSRRAASSLGRRDGRRSPRSIADFYRVKLAAKETAAARSAVTTIETTISRFLNGNSPAATSALPSGPGR